MKTNTLHRQLHPIHWHASMYLAIMAILLSAIKASDGIVRFLQASYSSDGALSSLVMRDAETVHSALAVGGAVRHTTVSGN
jgi:hypothetical protein